MYKPTIRLCQLLSIGASVYAVLQLARSDFFLSDILGFLFIANILGIMFFVDEYIRLKKQELENDPRQRPYNKL